MRIAILADIHGNLPALEAVVEDARHARPDAVYVAGDQINRCPWSNEVMDLLAAEGWPLIAGNHELVVAMLGQPTCPAYFSDRRRFPDLWWTWQHLSTEHMATIRSLPLELRLVLRGGPAILLVHGSPKKITVGFAPDLDDAQLVELLAGTGEPVVIGAHTHQPMDRYVVGQRGMRQRVLNPGSVGMPYNGDPRAQYMLLDHLADGLRVTFRQVDYPVVRVRQEFERLEMERWLGPVAALHLRTIETGLPWISDFLFWMRGQPAAAVEQMDRAVATYMGTHGPGCWAFAPE